MNLLGGSIIIILLTVLLNMYFYSIFYRKSWHADNQLAT